MKKSIMQTYKECYICGRHDADVHHVFYGSANRRLSDDDGCIIYLCRDHHTGTNGIHFNPEFDAMIKKECQIAWMRTNEKTVDDFRKRYGKSYL